MTQTFLQIKFQQNLTLKLSNLYDKKGQKLRTCMPWQSREVLVQPCSFLRGWRQCRHLTANRRTKPSWPFFSAFLPLYASRAEWCALILILLAILCAPYNSQWAKLQRFKLHSIEKKPCTQSIVPCSQHKGKLLACQQCKL